MARLVFLETVGVKRSLLALVCCPIAALLLGLGGCSNSVSLLNPAFVNTFSGGTFPLTPGPGAAFVLIRCLNETRQTAEFLVTIEREVLETDDDGNFLFETDGTPVTRVEIERKRLQTLADAPANELGVLFDCSDSPLKRVGLGENLLPTDPGVFIGGQGVAGVPGFGVSAEGVNPLSFEAGNFTCGDTIIFRAFESIGRAGGVALQSFVLSGAGQPETFRGPNTFANYAAFLEAQQREAP